MAPVGARVRCRVHGPASGARGVALNGEVLATFEQISAHVSKATGVVGESAAASEQQAQGVAQIDVAVGQVNVVTPRVAANAEESASAANELESQARTMSNMVGAFRLSAAATTVGAARPAARPATHPAARPASVARGATPRAAPARTTTTVGSARSTAARMIPFGDDEGDAALGGF